MAMYDVESLKTAKIKAYDVENCKTAKLKKAYVVENGKLAKLWSSASPQYMITTASGVAHLSEDAVNWEQVNVPLSKGCKCVYGNGTYVMVFDPYVTAQTASDFKVATSKDGRNWTLRTIGTVTPLAANMFNLHFCNGQFIATYSSFESGYKYHVYTSSDGVTWTKRGNSGIALPTLSNSSLKNQHIVYGSYSGQKRYVVPTTSSWAYSSDLLNWTSFSGSQAQALDSLYTSDDGTVFAIIANSGSPKICKLDNGLISIASGFYSGYVCASCYDEDNDEVCLVVGENNGSSADNKKHLFSTKDRGSITGIGPDFYGGASLNMNGLVFGNGKYVTISTGSSNTSIARCHYTSGGAWTEVEIGTTGNTKIYNSGGLIFAKGE